MRTGIVFCLVEFVEGGAFVDADCAGAIGACELGGTELEGGRKAYTMPRPRTQLRPYLRRWLIWRVQRTVMG